MTHFSNSYRSSKSRPAFLPFQGLGALPILHEETSAKDLNLRNI